ncbi:MAG: hypothetical protein GKS00_05550 [Alphaproteobacteria bacterium]|nr:hypothetical protein [Alphaproteobacteria bacterium]
MTAQTLPVTVIGGYLGAGKTTLINHLLRHADGLRLAVLVNDFGELPIDADLIESRNDNVISITGGCMCCAYGSDLMAALADLDRLEMPPDHLLIEASGVGLPDAIAQSVRLIPRYAIDGIAVLADAETVHKLGKDQYLQDTIERQLDAADVIILNKVDLASDEGLEKTRRWLSGRAPDSRIIEAVSANIPLSVLLGSGMEHVFDEGQGEGHNHDHATHEAAVFTLDRPVEPEMLAKRLAAREVGLVRTKGFVQAPDGGFYTLQTVGRRWSVSEAPSSSALQGRIVCITHRPPIDAEKITLIINSEC